MKSVLTHPLLRIFTPGPELVLIFMPVYSSTLLLTLKEAHVVCANNAVVLSELACLRGNHSQVLGFFQWIQKAEGQFC